MEDDMKIYIAAGWFTPEQDAARLKLIEACTLAKVQYFSPRDDNLWELGRDPNQCFEENILQIETCDALLVSTEGKDIGTSFECGYAYAANTPLIFYWPKVESLNLMLSESSHFVGRNVQQIVQYLKESKFNSSFLKREYRGPRE